jgi:hypothetical protein
MPYQYKREPLTLDESNRKKQRAPPEAERVRAKRFDCLHVTVTRAVQCISNH